MYFLYLLFIINTDYNSKNYNSKNKINFNWINYTLCFLTTSTMIIKYS